MRNDVVVRVNGRKAMDLEAVRAALKAPRGDFHVLELLPGQERGRLIFPVQGMAEANRRVRQRYGIVRPESRATAGGG